MLIDTNEDFAVALRTAADGATIQLTAGAYDFEESLAAFPRDLTVIGCDGAMIGAFHPMDVSGVSGLHFRGVDFTGCIILKDIMVSDFSVVDCTFTGPRAGVCCGGDRVMCRDVTITDCAFDTMGAPATHTPVAIFNLSGTNRINDNLFIDAGYNALRVSLTRGAALDFEDNVIEGARDRAIRITGMDENSTANIARSIIACSGNGAGQVFKASSVDAAAVLRFESNTADGENLSVTWDGRENAYVG